MSNSTAFPRLYGTTLPDGTVDPQALSRIQDNINSTLRPAVAELAKTPIMGAAPPAWIYPSLLNGWVANTAYARAAFHRDALGYVHIKGSALNSTGGGMALAMFLLPVGYRPSDTNVFAAVDDAGGVRPCSVGPDGFVFPDVIAAGDTQYFNFTFLAEQ
jgi:hypothetical protein